MNKKDFLLEIGCEELPAHQQEALVNHFDDLLKKGLENAKIEYGETHRYITPRRIAVFIENVTSTQPSQEMERQGPAYDNAFDKSGTPTLACLGFARSCGVSTDQLEIKDSPKGRRVFCRIQQPDKPTSETLPDLVKQAIRQWPLPKSMRWGNHDFAFIRPVKWVVMLFGRDVVSSHILGKQTGRDTQGHRFLCPKKLSISDPRDYNATLYSRGHVIADYNNRRSIIEKSINKVVGSSNKPIIDPDLLNEVTGLVEWPVALVAKFNPKYLELPREVLITSMTTHLKCFPVEDVQSKLLSQFILISNIDTENPEWIIRGNEKVINARLSDAEFFYKNDLKKSLEARLNALKQVVFQKKLGTLEEKSQRLSKLAGFIAKQIDANETATKRAALLSKCDLSSEMVIEFPNLQGTMGYYYALNDKESEDCAVAIKEQYLPRFSGDSLPNRLEGAALSLADRLDTLVGIFSINKHPTGDKDPYGLRRAALGVLRVLIEKQLNLDLVQLIKETIKIYGNTLSNNNILDQTFVFIMDRLKYWYQEHGVANEVFEAVSACRPTVILDFHRRIGAVQKFQTLPEAKALSSANKRVSNLLKKNNGVIPKKPNAALFKKEEEKTLAGLLEKQQKSIDILYKKADYTRLLTELSSLKAPIDDFFDQVMIMDKNEKIRLNRLALLASLHHLFSQVADISLLS